MVQAHLGPVIAAAMANYRATCLLLTVPIFQPAEPHRCGSEAAASVMVDISTPGGHLISEPARFLVATHSRQHDRKNCKSPSQAYIQ